MASHNDKTSVVDADSHFIINPVTRTIQNDGEKNLVQFDHNSERKTFECPRFVEGHDMLNCNKVIVNYLDNDLPGVYEVDDLTMKDTNTVMFSWLISSNATQKTGNIFFAITFMCVQTNGDVTYRWNTAINQGLKVIEGMNQNSTIVYDNVDILEQWKQQLFGTSDGEISKIQEATNECLKQIPSDYSDLNTKVDKNTTSISELKESLDDKAYNIEHTGNYTIYDRKIHVKPYGVDVETGKINEYIKRAHTDIITSSDEMNLIVNILSTKLQINIAKYTKTGSFVGYELNEYANISGNNIVLQPNFQYILVFKYSDDRDITDNDLADIENTVSISASLPIWYESVEYSIVKRDSFLLQKQEKRVYPFTLPTEIGGINSDCDYYFCKNNNMERTRSSFPVYLYKGEVIISKNNNNLLYSLYDDGRKKVEYTTWNGRKTIKIEKDGWYMIASNNKDDTILIHNNTTNLGKDRVCKIITDSYCSRNVYLSDEKKIDLKADFLTNMQKSPQGIAIYNDYIFQGFTDGYIRIFSFNTNELLYSIKADNLGHMSQLQFYGEETDTGFPLLYVSDGESQYCYIVKISLTAYVLIKTYKFDEIYGYALQVAIDNNILYTCGLDKNNVNDKTAKFIITAYTMEESNDGDYIKLTPTTTFNIGYQGVIQGAVIINGNMYISCNTWSETKTYITVVNLETKNIIRKIVATKSYNAELEGLCVYDNDINYDIYTASWYDTNERYYKVIRLAL